MLAKEVRAFVSWYSLMLFFRDFLSTFLSVKQHWKQFIFLFVNSQTQMQSVTNNSQEVALNKSRKIKAHNNRKPEKSVGDETKSANNKGEMLSSASTPQTKPKRKRKIKEEFVKGSDKGDKLERKRKPAISRKKTRWFLLFWSLSIGKKELKFYLDVCFSCFFLSQTPKFWFQAEWVKFAMFRRPHFRKPCWAKLPVFIARLSNIHNFWLAA